MNYIICFWDKSKIQVSQEVGERLKEAIRTESIKTFELEKSLYAIAGIEKIIPKDEAYNIFPTETSYLATLVNIKPNVEGLKRLEQMKLKAGLKK